MPFTAFPALLGTASSAIFPVLFDSYLSVPSGSSYEGYRWSRATGPESPIPVSTSISGRIEAVLSSGDVLARDGDTGIVYGADGRKKFDFPMGSLHFAHEYRTATATGQALLHDDVLAGIGRRGRRGVLHPGLFDSDRGPGPAEIIRRPAQTARPAAAGRQTDRKGPGPARPPSSGILQPAATPTRLALPYSASRYSSSPSRSRM